MFERTYIPFLPNIRVSGEEVELELYEQIKKAAHQYGKREGDFSAKIELLPRPDGEGHFFVAELTYRGGELSTD